MDFIDLGAQQARIKDKLDARIQTVLSHGKYILGPEVAQLEAGLAAFCGARHAITCANGTDALQLALMALGIGPGDAVFVPSFSFAATAEVVPLVGATPVFVDADPESFNMNPNSLKRSIAHIVRSGDLSPKAIIAVDLFGLPADYDSLRTIAHANDMALIGDSAQGFGGNYRGATTGSLADITTTSFFPAKPLGCYGDGGAIFTDDDNLANLLVSLRFHGKGDYKYDNVRIGLNSRLDTIQAAVLLEKLAIYGSEIEERQRVAERYSTALRDVIGTPVISNESRSIWAQYTVKTPAGKNRADIQAAMNKAGVPTQVYYPKPLHVQGAYNRYPIDPVGLKASEALSNEVFSLPMHPYLTADEQDTVIRTLKAALK